MRSVSLHVSGPSCYVENNSILLAGISEQSRRGLVGLEAIKHGHWSNHANVGSCAAFELRRHSFDFCRRGIRANRRDTVAGKDAFAQCSACHNVGESAKNQMGPYLTGVVGRKAGSAEGFKYSQAMTKDGENGLVWTPQTLDQFLQAPHD